MAQMSDELHPIDSLLQEVAVYQAEQDELRRRDRAGHTRAYVEALDRCESLQRTGARWYQRAMTETEIEPLAEACGELQKAVHGYAHARRHFGKIVLNETFIVGTFVP